MTKLGNDYMRFSVLCNIRALENCTYLNGDRSEIGGNQRIGGGAGLDEEAVDSAMDLADNRAGPVVQNANELGGGAV